jgi:sigma-B regulation protein RsbU (phosphoserine phosphatase)
MKQQRPPLVWADHVNHGPSPVCKVNAENRVRVLLIEEDLRAVHEVRSALAHAGEGTFDLRCALCLAAGLELIEDGAADVVLLAIGPNGRAQEALEHTLTRAPSTPVVVLANPAQELQAMKALQTGAADYLLKGRLDGELLARSLRYAIKRKRSELALRQSESLFHSLVEGLPQNIYRKDRDGRFTFANHRFCTTLARPLAEVLGKTDLDFYPRDLAEKHRREDRRVLQTGQPLELVEVRHSLAGERTFVQVIKTPVLDFRGRVVGTQGIFWDITEWKRGEEALRREHDRLEKMLEGAAEGIVVIDESGTILEANDLYAEILGFGRAWEVVGKNVLPFTAPEDRERNADAIRYCFATGGIRNFAFRYVNRHGAEVPVRLNARLMADDGTGVAKAMTLVVDETERLRTEAALRASEEELRVARQIQQGLYPKAPPDLPGFDVAGRSVPANATGGDYFDYVAMLGGCTGLVVGDASGHGVGPALLSASTRAYLRALALTEADAGEILTRANRLLAGDISQDHFVTVFLGRLDAQTRSFAYASAGHPTGYVLDRAGQVKARLESTGFPLGIEPAADIPAAPPVLLDPGDVLVVFTDGLLEAGPLERGQFRTERALDVLRAHLSSPAGVIVDALYDAVRAYCHPQPPPDDITAVVVKAL